MLHWFSFHYLPATCSWLTNILFDTSEGATFLLYPFPDRVRCYIRRRMLRMQYQLEQANKSNCCTIWEQTCSKPGNRWSVFKNSLYQRNLHRGFEDQYSRNFIKFGMYSKPAFFHGIVIDWEKTEHGSLSDFWKNSPILRGNAFYKSRLHEFLTPAVGSNPRWVLCYRASTHGWAASTFHSRCDGKLDTVTIIKTGQYVFGGYTDIPWGMCQVTKLSSFVWDCGRTMRLTFLRKFRKVFFLPYKRKINVDNLSLNSGLSS